MTDPDHLLLVVVHADGRADISSTQPPHEVARWLTEFAVILAGEYPNNEWPEDPEK